MKTFGLRQRVSKLIWLGLLPLWLGLVTVPGNAALFTVHVFNFDFSVNPSGQPIVDPTISVGDTVRWQWDEGFHSSTAAAGQSESWNSGVVGPGVTFDHTFNNVGVFNYYCIPHGADLGNGDVSGMAGSVTVVPEAPTELVVFLLGLALAGRHLRRSRLGRILLPTK